MNPNTIDNFLTCLESHPAFPTQGGRILLAYSNPYKPFIDAVEKKLIEKNKTHQTILFSLDGCDAEKLKPEIEAANIYLIFYDSDYSAPQLKPYYILQTEAVLKSTWKKSCIIKNYKGYLDEAFGTPPSEIKIINDKLVKIASSSKKMYFKDDLGSHLEIDIDKLKWTSIDGFGNPDLVPGEIAAGGRVSGKAFFKGSFLSTLPFAYNYGIIKDEPLYLEFTNNEITLAKGISKDFEEQFAVFLGYRKSNRTVEEVGIGTNPTVKDLYAANAGFEERHIGLHLGLGGAEAGSNHVDLIFKAGEIWFDQTLVIKNERVMI